MYHKTLPWLLLFSATISSVYNVPTRKSFDLHVPGKAPIRIIDSNPSWDGPPGGSEEFEHRTMKSNMRYKATTPQTYIDREDSTEVNDAYETSQFPSAKLQNFLKNYANKVHKKNEPSRDMDEIKLMNRPIDEDEAHFSETLHDDSSDHRQDVKQDKANKWDLIHVQKYQQPVLETAETNRYHSGGSDNNNKPTGSKIFTLNSYHSNSNSNKDKDSNKQGWVTLEAVPWSVSKISKWESNQQKKRPWLGDSYGSSSINTDKYNTNKYTSKPWLSSLGYYGGNNDNPNPWEHYTSTVAYRPEKPSYSKPTAGYRPQSSYFSNRPGPGYDKDELDLYQLSTSLRPRPVVDYDQNLYNRPLLSASLIQELSSNPFTDRPWNRPSNRPGVIGNDYGRPYWNKLSQLHHNQQYHSDNSDCEHNKYKLQGEIITDGLPGNFPKDIPNRRRGVEQEEQPETEIEKVSEDHPETHPANGNGEWVLLSTTKGYQYQRPAERQRSLKIVPAQRQVRLTVLPPDKKSNVNMTTSHGGLLEVESTFQTVEQAQKQYANQMRFNGTRLSLKPPKGTPQMPTQVQKLRNANGLDSTAVVAAVGAGMIPAAAIGAMLVPMAMGRKKRSLFATTHHPLEYQLTLPRSL